MSPPSDPSPEISQEAARAMREALREMKAADDALPGHPNATTFRAWKKLDDRAERLRDAALALAEASAP